MSQPDIEAHSDDIPPGVTADLLASERRCRLLSILSEEGETAVVDLAVGVLDECEEPTHHERTRMLNELFGRHLPALTAINVVKYNSQLGTVVLRDQELGERATQTLGEQ